MFFLFFPEGSNHVINEIFPRQIIALNRKIIYRVSWKFNISGPFLTVKIEEKKSIGLIFSGRGQEVWVALRSPKVIARGLSGATQLAPTISLKLTKRISKNKTKEKTIRKIIRKKTYVF